MTKDKALNECFESIQEVIPMEEIQQEFVKVNLELAYEYGAREALEESKQMLMDSLKEL